MTTSFQLYNTSTDVYGKETSSPYMMDGEPGPLPPDTVELTVIRYPVPENVPEGKVILPYSNLDLEELTLFHGWTEQDAPIPDQITDKQLFFWLIDHDLYQQVQDIIPAIQDPVERLKAEIHLNRSKSIERNHPMTLFITASLGMTPEEVDQAFVEASKIVA